MADKEKVVQKTVITDSDIITEIWQVYQDSFADTDNFCAQDQICYTTPEIMAEALADPDYQKFILMVNEKIIGLCLLTNNLVKARIAYCNDRFLRKKFPKFTSQGRLYYVTAICVLPEWQNKNYGIELLKSVCQFINDNNAMVAYDYSENKNASLTGLIKYVGKKLGWHIIEIPLDTQHYTSLYYEHTGTPE